MNPLSGSYLWEQLELMQSNDRKHSENCDVADGTRRWRWRCKENENENENSLLVEVKVMLTAGEPKMSAAHAGPLCLPSCFYSERALWLFRGDGWPGTQQRAANL
jgi:hypothetical protein